MFVYVLNKHGKPLMPCQPRKARILLRDGKAKVIKREPFTIQLKFGSSEYKQKILKGGKRKLNQAAYSIHGFHLFDKVRFAGQECFVFGRRTSGYFDLRKLDGTVVHRSASWRQLQKTCNRKSILISKEVIGAPPTTEVAGVRAEIS